MSRTFLVFVLLAGCQRSCEHRSSGEPTRVAAMDAATMADTGRVEVSLEDALPQELADAPPFGNVRN